MKNWMTKKNITIFFAICASLFAALQPQWVRTLCYENNLSCVSFRMFLLPFVWGCFPISIALYFLRDEIFRSWIKFIAWWLPLGSLLLVIGLNTSNGFVGPLFPAQFFAFTIISMSGFLFILKSLELRRADQGNPLAWWIKWPSFVAAFALSVIFSAYSYGLIW